MHLQDVGTALLLQQAVRRALVTRVTYTDVAIQAVELYYCLLRASVSCLPLQSSDSAPRSL